MDYLEIRAIARKLRLNMDQVAQEIDMTRPGLQKSVDLKTLRIDKAVQLAKVLKLDPGMFLLSFIDAPPAVPPEENPSTMLQQVLSNQVKMMEWLKVTAEKHYPNK